MFKKKYNSWLKNIPWKVLRWEHTRRQHEQPRFESPTPFAHAPPSQASLPTWASAAPVAGVCSSPVPLVSTQGSEGEMIPRYFKCDEHCRKAIMPKQYTRKTTWGKTPLEEMESAAAEVKEGKKSIRTAARDRNIDSTWVPSTCIWICREKQYPCPCQLVKDTMCR